MPTGPNARTARLRCEPLEDRLTPADLGSLLVGQAFPGYSGPVSAVVGDVNADGTGDVIAAAAVDGHVKVFDGRTGVEVRSFFAYPGYAGTVRVAAADVSGSGLPDIITAAGRDGHVEVFDAAGGLRQSFLAYPGYAGDVSVDVAEALPATYGAGPAGPGAIVTRAAANGHVKTFDGRTGAPTGSFLAYPGYTGPVRVTAATIGGVTDVLTVAEQDGHVKVFDGATGAEAFSYAAYPGYTGPVQVSLQLDPDAPGGARFVTGLLTTVAPNGQTRFVNVSRPTALATFFDPGRFPTNPTTDVFLSPPPVAIADAAPV